MAPITPTEDYLACLSSLMEPAEVLEKHGFIFQQLEDEELLLKRRCAGCGKLMGRLVRKRPPPADAPLQADPAAEPRKIYKPKRANEVPSQLHKFHPDHIPTANVPKEPQFRCKYHLGHCINKVWLCCNQPVAAKTEPCGGAHEHVPRPQDVEELYDLYQCYPAPNSPPGSSSIRAAVAIDCEMGTAVSGDTELIRVTLVDYFTEEILVDNIVEPDVPMQHLNTKYSGVSWADVNKARREGTILDGKGGARQAIWQFAGPDTFVIGHGASNDLRSLRWIHLRVVDSMVTEFVRTKAKEAKEAEEMKLKLAKEAEELVLTQAEEAVLRQMMMAAIAEHDAGATKTVLDAATVPPAAEEKAPAPKPKNLSLKTMTKKYLDRDIQTKGKVGHDSLEDAIAARDLVHRNVCEVMRG